MYSKCILFLRVIKIQRTTQYSARTYVMCFSSPERVYSSCTSRRRVRRQWRVKNKIWVILLVVMINMIWYSSTWFNNISKRPNVYHKHTYPH